MTEEEVQAMIDISIAKVIRKYNKNDFTVSMCAGWTVFALFVEGLLRLR